MKFFEIHETTHSVYLVLEYLPGGELLRKISRKKIIKDKYIRVIMKKILRGLAYMHNLGIMHRDLKFENLMLMNKKISSIRFIDFGLATFIDDENYIHKRCGTPGFVAPEVILKGKTQDYNEKCDVFSAGVIFYIL